jgi:hypothetical protein
MFFAFSDCVLWILTNFFNSLEHFLLMPLMWDGLYAPQISDTPQVYTYRPALGLICGD